MVLHAGLHWNLRDHPLSTFTSLLSLSLIYGAGLLGFVYVIFSPHYFHVTHHKSTLR